MSIQKPLLTLCSAIALLPFWCRSDLHCRILTRSLLVYRRTGIGQSNPFPWPHWSLRTSWTTRPYGVAESLAGYKRAAATHNWTVSHLDIWFKLMYNTLLTASSGHRPSRSLESMCSIYNHSFAFQNPSSLYMSQIAIGLQSFKYHLCHMFSC